MLSDAYIEVTCDGCHVIEVVQLTACAEIVGTSAMSRNTWSPSAGQLMVINTCVKNASSNMKTYDWIHIAIEDASISPGGPFGAVIVRGKKLITRATNLVIPNHDPTAHAEIMAIRQACQILGTHSLQGYVMYASCEPCPMCLAAILWSELSELYFAATRKDASALGFKDTNLHDLFQVPPQTKWPLPTNWVSGRACKEAVAMMKAWTGEMYGAVT